MNHRSPQQIQEDIQAIWMAGLEAVCSERLIRESVQVTEDDLQIVDSVFSLQHVDRIIVVGGGKAGAGMVTGLESALGNELMQRKRVQGIVSVPADCVQSTQHISLAAGRPAGQNSPTQEGVETTRQMLRLIESLTVRDLCICLISGGGSALLTAPADGISLTEKQEITKFLSGAGANIEQLNTVRKQLSRIKGNGLARACQAGNLVSLIISDVPGDPLDVISSGPTVTNTTTAADAIQVLQDFGADQQPQFSGMIRRLGTKAADPRSKNQRTACSVTNYVIGNNAVAVDAAGIEAEKRGYSHAMQSSNHLEGLAEDVGRHHFDMAIKMRNQPGPDCLITGGEPVVELADESERGLGGRNQQLVLSALQRAMQQDSSDPLRGIAMLSGGTDGEDGPTDAAGAWIDQACIESIRNLDLDPASFLARNDAYHFFKPLGRLIQTGPTHTNVCDLRVVVVDRIQPQP